MEACEVIEMDANAPEAIPEKRCYTVEEIQTILNISRGTAYKLLEKKEFRWFKVGSMNITGRRSRLSGGDRATCPDFRSHPA